MTAGRNDPCPCGSGRKYKKCCLAREEAPRAAEFFRDEDRTAALRRLVAFADGPDFETDRELAEILFWGGLLENFPEEERASLVEAESSRAAFSAFFLFDLDVEGGRSPCDMYLERHGARLSAPEREFLERAGRSHVRPYEVTEVRRQEGLRVRDLWEDGPELWVRERLATEDIVRWDLLAARLVEAAPGVHELEGGIHLYRREDKDELLAKLREAREEREAKVPGGSTGAFFKRYAFLFQQFLMEKALAPRPGLVTAEGDPVEFGTGIFTVADEPALRRALAEHPAFAEDEKDVFAWREGGGRILGMLRLSAPHLVAEVQSRARMARLRELLRAQAGDAVEFRSARYQDPWAAVDAPEDGDLDEPAPFDELPPEEAERLRREVLGDYYVRWLDEPIPALGGRTPRQAARTTAGRPKVEELLKILEISEARDAPAGIPPYDFGWLRRELGL